MSDLTSAGLFPGQGSQTAGMGDWVAAVRPDLHARACELVGEDPFAGANERSACTQPAIYCASLVAWAELDSDPALLAGHSLGEFAALVAGGALDEQAGLELVVLRGKLSDQACHSQDGGMLAVLGRRAHSHAAHLAQETGLSFANDNSPRQVVLSGRGKDVRAALELAAAKEIDVAELAVAGAFHSPMMAPIVEEFRAALNAVQWAEPATPVFSSITAQPFTDPVTELALALTQQVRWQDTINGLSGRGVTRWIEVGPGRVLTGLVRRIVSGADTVTVDPGLVTRV